MAAVLDSLAAPRAAARPSPPPLRSLSAFHGAKGLRVGRGFQRWALSSPATGSRSERLNLARRRLVCEAKEAAVEAVASVNDSTWQALVLNSDTPALVEFWAPWCGPCRMIEPVVIELAQQYAGKLKCFKLNTDESPSIATQYGIRSIPTVIIFKNGEKKDAIIGAVPKSTLISSIEKFL